MLQSCNAVVIKRATLPCTCLQGLLLPHEVDGLMQAQHRPNYVLQVGRDPWRCRHGQACL